MSKRKYTNSKESILDTAVRVLAREGARGFSTEAVIRESGLSKAGFFYNYKSKKELMIAVMRKLSEDWAKEVSEIETADPNPIGRSLRAHLRVSIKYYIDPSPEALALNKAFGEVYLLEPDLFDDSSNDQFLALFDKDEGLPREQSVAVYLAISGFWMNEASNYYKMPALRKKKLLDLLIQMTEGPVRIDKTPVPKKKNQGGRVKILIFLAASLFGLSAHAEALSLNSFLLRVSKDNSSVESQRLGGEASELRASEGYLLTSPNLFALGNTSVDKKQVQNTAFEGTQRNSKTFQFGVEQQSSFGINHKLFYALDQSELIGVDPNFFPNPAVSRSSFNYELSLPVWRNGFGRSTREQVNALVSQNKSESFTAKFTRKQIKANAVVVYWRMKSAQALYSLSSELLESNTKFLKWTKARVRDRLGEGTDLKQAEAALALREYDLEQARMDLNEAQQLFNEMLEVSPETPVPELEDLPNIDSWPSQLKLVAPQSREDILSLEELLSAQNSQSKIAAETTKPQVDLTSLFSTNGLAPLAGDSFNRSLTTNNPAYTVGLRLSIPLDRGSVGDVQKSATIRSAAIDAQLRRKKFEVKAEFERLERNYAQAMKVYSTAKAVERAQLAKYNLESERRKSGRTTTFQLLSFQQEYQSAKQALIRAKNAVLQLNAQSSLFSNESGASL